MQLGEFDWPADAGAKSVTLTTIHGGKGAEWPVVILVGCEDGLFLGGDTIVESSAKYLGLPGPKPMLGWGNVRHNTRSVSVVEGPLDLLALGMWGVPGIALARSYASEHNLHLLERFDRLYLALDQDDGGRSATWELASRFGPRAVPVALPPGVKDPADLARLIDGEQLFRSALRAADDAYRLVA
jgi:hypothetical protein